MPCSLQASTGAKKSGMAGLQLGSNIPDFMELTAPAVLPQELCPSWMPEDSWVGLLFDAPPPFQHTLYAVSMQLLGVYQVWFSSSCAAHLINV